ncbi:lipid IV(A) 3-deoxy-D-manno-octulosonic acid transferase [Vibrio coralliirubri]|uniref:lipid IV(A) 3-deoxy-D-manno-octulosonic acid transferase n=1 Tax=Vibrio coralliirubri TaxID=1516159 RepID=UPI000A3CBB97|nr:lipid IV(A) 3-deoxy-D-manno-octulosonic acid transferase [Vibrio coralliirubri]
MIRILYCFLLVMLSPPLLFGLYRKRPNKPKFGKRWIEHFGFGDHLDCKQQPLWIHTVSVGETIAAIPFIRKLKEQEPNLPIVLTTTTSTGAEQAKKLGTLVIHRYMPIDFGWCIKNFLKRVGPYQLLIMETELWPNTLHTVHKASIPITVMNARLSEKSLKNYSLFSSFFKQLSNNLSLIICQQNSDKDRFLQLGVPEHKLTVVGSIKYDINITKETIEHANQLRNRLGINRPIWIAASTHKGEDEKILTAHEFICKHLKDALLILVPRHPERFDDVFALCNKLNLITVRRTKNDMVTQRTQVYLADTMGEMLPLIGCADVCFMGGSLLGDKVGGHNILEPASLRKPIVIGPSYFNFSDIVNTLRDRDACIITTEKELKNNVINLLSDSGYATKLSNNATCFIKTQQGAIQRTLDNIKL